MIRLRKLIRSFFSSPNWRFFVFAGLFAALCMYILIKYGEQMLEPKREQAAVPYGFVERGPILDRNGRPLILSVRLGNVSAWRPEIINLEKTAQDLAPILDIPAGEIRDRLLLAPANFVYLKKGVDDSTIKQIDEAKAKKLLKGIHIEPVGGRIYPEERLAGPVLGYIGGDENKGIAGIEYAFEEDLAPPAEAGVPGKRKNPGTRNGSQVFLTLDANVQYILEDIARRTREENSAEAVMLMAMDPRNGDILGSASMPDFDPNDFGKFGEMSRMDRPALWAYEPGSVFKVFSLAALLDSGVIRPNTVFTCNGHYVRTTSRGEQITINCLAAHGPVTARDIIIKSCNAGAAYAADRMGAESFYNRLKDAGFGSRTGAGEPGETAGFLRPLERWSDRSKPTIAMGQEIAVSALQMLQAASAVANDGILVPPRIVSRIVSPDGTVRNYEPGSPRRIFKAETVRAIRSYMVDVTSESGTGWRANVGDISMAVKTGTAQLINPRTGTYSNTDFIASCIALLPSESPALVLYLVIIKPQGASYLGGRIAAPVIAEAAEALANYMGIPRGRNPRVAHSGVVNIPQETIPVINERVPNFTGLSKRQLLPLLFREDIQIEITGNGWVRRQSPPPGTVITENTIITLELE